MSNTKCSKFEKKLKELNELRDLCNKLSLTSNKARKLGFNVSFELFNKVGLEFIHSDMKNFTSAEILGSRLYVKPIDKLKLGFSYDYIRFIHLNLSILLPKLFIVCALCNCNSASA